MDETKFKLFMDIVACLEGSNIKAHGLQSSVFKLIKCFDDRLTEEQKRQLHEQHRKYESEKEKQTKHLREVSEEEDYRQNIRLHMREDEDSVGGF